MRSMAKVIAGEPSKHELSTETVGGREAPAHDTAHGAIAPKPATNPMARRATKRPASRRRILFLAANPRDTSQVVLDKECAAIENELRAARHADDFEFHSKWRVTIDAMAQHLFVLEPAIIHFSGQSHLDPSAPLDGPSSSQRPDSDQGIYLHDEGHREERAPLVSGSALAAMIKTAAPTTRIVVLNACWGDRVAEALCQVVDGVVGMTRHNGVRRTCVRGGLLPRTRQRFIAGERRRSRHSDAGGQGPDGEARPSLPDP